MPRKTSLKVFRTAIGFHDAYVAAPSRKAALAAWGTEKDLFARGAAQEVTDPALMEEPLSSPGTVFRQLRSMPPEEKPSTSRSAKANAPAPKRPMQPVPPPPPPPRPSDEEVVEAERALERARRKHAEERGDLASRERALAEERRAIEARQVEEADLLKNKLEAARERYEAQLEAWHEVVGDDHGT